MTYDPFAEPLPIHDDEVLPAEPCGLGWTTYGLLWFFGGLVCVAVFRALERLFPGGSS